MQISYLGPPGTYTEQAAHCWAPTAHLIPHNSIGGALRAVLDQGMDQAVVPVENSIEGTVGMTLDALWHLEGLQIQGALELPIAHALISYCSELALIQRVYSHPQALAQCQEWLGAFLPHAQQIPTASTTTALSYLSPDLPYAAIGSARAADLNQVPILVPLISDFADNRTRFWIVGRACLLDGERLALAFSPRRRGPGVLVQALLAFAVRGINLTRIESRPAKKALGEYVFFIELEGNQTQPLIREALEDLHLLTEDLKLLGAYRVRGAL